jgi:hypothetical protein
MREHEHLESETVEETQFRLKREEVPDSQVATEQSVSLNDLLQLTQQRLAQSIQSDDPATIQQWQAVVRGQMELLQQERRAKFKMWGGLGGMVVGAGICILSTPLRALL